MSTTLTIRTHQKVIQPQIGRFGDRDCSDGLVIFFAVPSVFRFEQSGAVHGSDAYDNYAQNLLQTGLGLWQTRMPVIHTVIQLHAGVYGLFGRSGLSVAGFNIRSIVYPSCTPASAFKQGEWVGTLAGLFYGLYPYLIFQNDVD